jgi:hypothetical protein
VFSLNVNGLSGGVMFPMAEKHPEGKLDFAVVHQKEQENSELTKFSVQVMSQLTLAVKSETKVSTDPSLSILWTPNIASFLDMGIGIQHLEKNPWNGFFISLGKQWETEVTTFSIYGGGARTYSDKGELKTYPFLTSAWKYAIWKVNGEIYSDKGVPKWNAGTELALLKNDDMEASIGYAWITDTGNQWEFQISPQRHQAIYWEVFWEPIFAYTWPELTHDSFLEQEVNIFTSLGVWVNRWDFPTQKKFWEQSWKQSFFRSQLPFAKKMKFFHWEKPVLYGGVFQDSYLGGGMQWGLTLTDWHPFSLKTFVLTNDTSWAIQPYFELSVPLHPKFTKWKKWRYSYESSKGLDNLWQHGLNISYLGKHKFRLGQFWKNGYKIEFECLYYFDWIKEFSSNKVGLKNGSRLYTTSDGSVGRGGINPNKLNLTGSWVSRSIMKHKVEVAKTNTDTDSDGVLNQKDQCPNSKEDIDGFADEDGCPDLDNDNDQIPDALDQCPNDAEDFDLFKDKDGCPDWDNDSDGLVDSLDLCIYKAEDKDGYLDMDGCPDLDNDNDGVPDERDVCLNDPEDLDGVDDADGCPDHSDQDGIPQDRDQCPSLNEDMDGFEDFDGCPDFDNDWDGINDEYDLCPNKPEKINGFQDADGCPE